jgi:hypothetical protein
MADEYWRTLRYGEDKVSTHNWQILRSDPFAPEHLLLESVSNSRMQRIEKICREKGSLIRSTNHFQFINNLTLFLTIFSMLFSMILIVYFVIELS